LSEIKKKFKTSDENDNCYDNNNDDDDSKLTCLFQTCIGGATCDSSDFVLNDFYMPEMNIGDFLVFKNMGAYTKTCAVEFNGIRKPNTDYISRNHWNLYKNAFNNEIKDTSSVSSGSSGSLSSFDLADIMKEEKNYAEMALTDWYKFKLREE
jgi:hypothetical protein